MGIIKTGRADPTHDQDEGDIDAYEVDVALDSNGDGSTTVSWEKQFGTSTPKLHVSASAGIGGWSARGASQATVTVSGGPADGTVTVTVIAVGDRLRV